MAETNINVLLIEDNPADVVLLRAALQKAGANEVALTSVERLSQGLELLQREAFDLVLLDLGLPDSNGIATFEMLRRQAPEMPVVVFSGSTDEQGSLQAMRAGAQDYLVKSLAGFEQAARTIRYAIERSQYQVKLRSKEKYWRALIEQNNDAIVRVDQNGNVLYQSPAVLHILGYTPEEVMGRNGFNLVYPPETPAVEKIFAYVLANPRQPTHIQTRMVRKDGSLCWVEATVTNWLDDPDLQAIIVNYRDITEVRQAHQELLELNRDLEERVRRRTAEVQDLYDHAPIGYHSLDAESRLMMINQTELNWLGYTREEMMGRSLLDFLEENSQQVFFKNFPAFKQHGWLKDLEMEFVRKDGTLLKSLVSATAVFDAKGAYIMSRSTVFDNTEKKLAEDALRISEAQLRKKTDELSAANAALEKAARAKDEFLASMSHELRTPLTGILGLAENLQLKTYGELRPRQMTALKHIEQSGQHLLELINDILDLSKIEAGKFELEFAVHSLDEICQASLQLIKSMAQQKGQHISFSMNPFAIPVFADGRRLKQMLVNLLSNAVKFTPEGGLLGLEVEEDAAVQLVYLTVWDKGIGIANGDIERLFQPFVQLDSSLARKQSGTGLGLSLVLRMAELHGGSMQVTSVPGEGSRFTIVLPSNRSRLESPQANLPPVKGVRRALTLAGAPGGEALGAILEGMGIANHLHRDLPSAVEAAARQEPDVIFAHLPGSVSQGLLQALKSDPRTQAIPVVGCDTGEPEAGEWAGFLSLPYQAEAVRQVLEQIAAAGLPSSAAAPGQGCGTVMVVDDNTVTLEAVCDYLQTLRYHTVMAHSGAELLSIISEFRPAIILMDIQMPGMDGLEATRRIRAYPDPEIARLPVIAMTALAMPGDRELCLKAGANLYLTKPVPLAALASAIHDLICQPGTKPSGPQPAQP